MTGEFWEDFTAAGAPEREVPPCGHVEELKRLRQLVTAHKARVTRLEETLARKNRELDALHMVWCDGGCGSGVHRWTDAQTSAELVAIAERNTRRLKNWYRVVKWRMTAYRAGTETELTPGFIFRASPWHEQYAKRNAAKTDLAETP